MHFSKRPYLVTIFCRPLHDGDRITLIGGFGCQHIFGLYVFRPIDKVDFLGLSH